MVNIFIIINLGAVKNKHFLCNEINFYWALLNCNH